MLFFLSSKNFIGYTLKMLHSVICLFGFFLGVDSLSLCQNSKSLNLTVF